MYFSHRAREMHPRKQFAKLLNSQKQHTFFRYFFAAFAFLSICATALFASLPHKEVIESRLPRNLFCDFLLHSSCRWRETSLRKMCEPPRWLSNTVSWNVEIPSFTWKLIGLPTILTLSTILKYASAKNNNFKCINFQNRCKPFSSTLACFSLRPSSSTTDYSSPSSHRSFRPLFNSPRSGLFTHFPFEKQDEFEVLSLNVYIPAIIGIALTAGSFPSAINSFCQYYWIDKSLSVSLITVKLSAAVNDFCFTYLVLINGVLHLVRWRMTNWIVDFRNSGDLRYRGLRDSWVEYCASKRWTIAACTANVSVFVGFESSSIALNWTRLILQGEFRMSFSHFRVYFVILMYVLFGAADSANNTTRYDQLFKSSKCRVKQPSKLPFIRIVISTLLLPESKQQTFGASKFYHVCRFLLPTAISSYPHNSAFYSECRRVFPNSRSRESNTVLLGRLWRRVFSSSSLLHYRSTSMRQYSPPFW